MGSRFGCWKPSWTGSALRAPATEPPIGFAWARPRVGDAKPAGRLSTTIKDVYVWPLHRNFRPHLNSIATQPLTNLS